MHQGRACVGCVLSRARTRQLKKKQMDGLVEGACVCREEQRYEVNCEVLPRRCTARTPGPCRLVDKVCVKAEFRARVNRRGR